MVGNPNIGKTTLFNALTGAKERVGNRAGVTVECAKRRLKGLDGVLIDLPGIYSLAPQSRDEEIAAEEIRNHKPDLIVNIVDATNLSRNLYLTTQLVELKVPLIIALNMMDEAAKLGLRIDAKRLEREIGARVVPICARTGEGLDELKAAMRSTIKLPVPLCYGCDARRRFECTRRLCAEAVERPIGLDRLFTHRIFGFPIFFAIMGLIFYLTFDSLGAWLSDGAETLVADFLSPLAEEGLMKLQLPFWAVRLIVDGLLMGVCGVLTFLPQVALLFLFLSLLEDCGYLARISFLTDTFLSKIGLSGKAFVPLFMGFGCTVPAALAARTLGRRSERRRTLRLLPFLPCSAKLPVFGLLARAFFPRHRGLIVLSLYVLGIIVGILLSLLTKAMKREGEEAPFILELPPYRKPVAKNTLMLVGERTSHFLFRAGTVILCVSALLWALMHFDPALCYTDAAERSLIGVFGAKIAPAFTPLGFGFYQAAVALLVGLVAKEAVLSSLLLFFNGSVATLTAAFSPLSAYCFMAFVLLYPPCFAALVTMRREYGGFGILPWLLIGQPLLAYGICNILHCVLQNCGF